jgi:Methylase involved in ubiquinone/menaquinone biosynthesis
MDKEQERARFFDERAAEWERNCYPAPVRQRLWPMVEGFALPVGGHVLDMGTGPGTLIPYLRRAIGPQGRITAFDASPGMVAVARVKCMDDRTEVLCSSAMDMPFEAGRFDAVVCFAAFPHFSDKPRALCEMARVAKPGARIVIAHLLGRRQLEAHHGSHPAVADDRLPGDEALCALFLQAGLPAPQVTSRENYYEASSIKP